jgi:mRNA-degrading endonuclease YafQ of YafQ-DinJ toxin-antitoxin module
MSFAITTSTKFDRAIKRLAKKYASMADDFAELLAELRKTRRPASRWAAIVIKYA